MELVLRLEKMTSETKNQTQEDPENEDQAASAKKKPMLVGVVVTAVMLGGAAGGLVIGPRVVGVVSGQEQSETAESSHGAHDEVTGKFLELENLIVNTAGSWGERFLMVTVAFEVPDDISLNLLHEREIQVRDVVSATLGARTLESLAAPGARESIKQELSEVVAPFAGTAEWVRVYLPRFVIQ